MACGLLEFKSDSAAVIAAGTAFARTLLQTQTLHAAARELAYAARSLPAIPAGAGSAALARHADGGLCEALYRCLFKALTLVTGILYACELPARAQEVRYELLADMAAILVETQLLEHAARLLLLLRCSQPPNFDSGSTAAPAAAKRFAATYARLAWQARNERPKLEEAGRPAAVAHLRMVLSRPCTRHAVTVLGLCAMECLGAFKPGRQKFCRCYLHAAPVDPHFCSTSLQALAGAPDLELPQDAACTQDVPISLLERSLAFVFASAESYDELDVTCSKGCFLAPSMRAEAVCRLLPVYTSNTLLVLSQGQPWSGLWQRTWSMVEAQLRPKVVGESMPLHQRTALMGALAQLMAAVTAPLRLPDTEGTRPGAGHWRLLDPATDRVDQALEGRALPVLERLLRRGADDPSSLEAALLSCGPALALDFWAGALALLAYAHPTQAAAFTASVAKALRRAEASEAPHAVIHDAAAQPQRAVAQLVASRLCAAVSWVSGSTSGDASDDGTRSGASGGASGDCTSGGAGGGASGGASDDGTSGGASGDGTSGGASDGAALGRLALVLSAALPAWLPQLSRLVRAAAAREQAAAAQAGQTQAAAGAGQAHGAGHGAEVAAAAAASLPGVCGSLEALLDACRVYLPGPAPPAPEAGASSSSGAPGIGGAVTACGAAGRDASPAPGSSGNSEGDAGSSNGDGDAHNSGGGGPGSSTGGGGGAGGSSAQDWRWAVLEEAGVVPLVDLALGLLERPRPGLHAPTSLAALTAAWAVALMLRERDAVAGGEERELAEGVEAATGCVEAWVAGGEGDGAGLSGQLGWRRGEGVRLAALMVEPGEARRRLGVSACANPACRSLAGESEAGLRLQQCGRCGRVSYCCRECQMAHWRQNALTMMLSARSVPTARVQARRAGSRAAVCRSRVLVVASAATEKKFDRIPPWETGVFPSLQGKLSSISPEDAAKRIASGKWVLVDVRTREQYAEGHPEGAINVPLYESITLGGDVRRSLKYLLYKSNGVSPIDMNAEFYSQLAEAADGRGVITCCEAGGTLKPTINFPAGKSSRSLQAAYVIMEEGLAANVAHLERGIYGWFQADLPIEGEYRPDIGRTPMAVAEPQLKNIAASTGYEMRPGDKAVEEPKKEPKKFFFF
ncbi:hypothetical protein HYH03_016996 [Edaphochlamys debaryana]|uniref:Rhodanese domain-containing protein n=1 Tax=Edaphochlamys debaryana TaxID=47281 RepID=A0A835XIR1_9CHLO|nr:hypothetical protein HYH03_016996 [Edaphochlamys debaryana]|eukprot:KAG2484184.1 hypothetical protein HYH03_016996 [Edaphochlamys debaryana]